MAIKRLQAALDVIWPLAGELFQPDAVAARLPGVAVDSADLREEVDDVLGTVRLRWTEPGASRESSLAPRCATITAQRPSAWRTPTWNGAIRKCSSSRTPTLA